MVVEDREIIDDRIDGLGSVVALLYPLGKGVELLLEAFVKKKDAAIIILMANAAANSLEERTKGLGIVPFVPVHELPGIVGEGARMLIIIIHLELDVDIVVVRIWNPKNDNSTSL